jgi:hypothetical protein
MSWATELLGIVISETSVRGARTPRVGSMMISSTVWGSAAALARGLVLGRVGDGDLEAGGDCPIGQLITRGATLMDFTHDGPVAKPDPWKKRQYLIKSSPRSSWSDEASSFCIDSEDNPSVN